MYLFTFLLSVEVRLVQQTHMCCHIDVISLKDDQIMKTAWPFYMIKLVFSEEVWNRYVIETCKAKEVLQYTYGSFKLLHRFIQIYFIFWTD